MPESGICIGDREGAQDLGMDNQKKVIPVMERIVILILEYMKIQKTFILHISESVSISNGICILKYVNICMQHL